MTNERPHPTNSPPGPCSSNNARGGPILVALPSRTRWTSSPFRLVPFLNVVLWLSNTFHMKSLRHVRWAVLRRNPVLHLHPAQGGRTLYSPLEPGDILIDLEPLFWTPPGMVLELTLEKGFIRWSDSSVGKQDREMRVYAGLRGDDPVHSRYHVLDCWGACLLGRDVHYDYID